MNIVQKLTLAHLRENKGRTVVTVLGICVSVAMITAVFVGVASFLNFYGESIIKNYGNYHFLVSESKEKVEEVLESHNDEIDKVGHYYSLDGNYSGYRIPNGLSKRHSIGSWVAGDEEYLNQFITCEYEGDFPKNENEIMVEQNVIDKNNFNLKIGDIVEIETGLRTSSDSSYVTFPVKGTYRFGEKFETTVTKSYKIVGILHENSPTNNTGSLIRGISINENGTLYASVLMKDVNMKSAVQIESIVDDFDFSEKEKPFNVSINYSFLETKLAISPKNSELLPLFLMCVIILLIIIAASIAMIYNAFSMSFSEKVRYLGMLSSVGATKIQKKKSIYFEGFVLGAIGIPIGLCAGILGISAVFKLLENQILNSGIVTGLTEIGIVVPIFSVFGILVLSVLTIFISVYKPAKKASEITPIDAIRQTDEIKIKKEINTPFFIRKIFGYEGELAHKNLKRNGRKLRVITASIALSVILFLCCNYYCDLFSRYNKINDVNPAQVDVYVMEYDREQFVEFLSECSCIEDYYFYSTSSYSKSMNDVNPEDGEENTMFVKYDFFNEDTLSKKYSDIASECINVNINAVEDEVFDSLCEYSGVDSKPYYDIGENGEVKCIVMNNISHKDGEEGVLTDKFLGNEIYMYLNDPDFENTEEIIFGDRYIFNEFVKYDKDNYICSLNSSNSLSCYYPESAFKKLMEYYGETSDYQICYGIVTQEHEKATEEISDYLEVNNVANCSVSDNVASWQMLSAINLIIKVLIYGFVTLITLITIFNIINTISTSIALRKKEFAMLKSVGMTPKGLNKMVVLESAFYGIKALLFAIPISILSNFIINKVLSAAEIPFNVNWLLIFVVIAVVFLLIGSTMLYSVKKLKENSVVESLKDDIC